MNLLRRLSTPKLIAVTMLPIAAVLATGIALASSRSGPKPPPRSLASALNAALHSKPVAGFSARITFTNHLFPSGTIPGSPLLSGASGRLWLAGDGRFRVELQSDTGDTQITSDGHTLSMYDAARGTLYRLALPSRKASAADGASKAKPSHPFGVAQIQHALKQLSGSAILSGAIPGDIAGRPVYSVRVSPSHDGGLLGAVQLAWDAQQGVPLKVAIYSRGDSSPVLALTASDVHYGAISSSNLTVHAPASIKPVTVKLPTGSSVKGMKSRAGSSVTGTSAVAAALPFRLSAPSSLVGLPRKAVRLIQTGDTKAAVVLYGQGLGTIAVIEQQVSTDGATNSGPLAALPAISINGARGHELATALGTAIQVSRGGVTYTLIGSVPAVAAEAAARAVS
jgi:outer membrane lipoprotein-sorting protein